MKLNNIRDDKRYNNQYDNLPLIFVQYMITQELWKYYLTTNSVKSMQQTTLSLSEGDSSVCN